jgi:hypothetical protein
MTTFDVYDIMEYWSEHPPVNEVAMIGFGIEVKNKSNATKNILSPEELMRMANELNRR